MKTKDNREKGHNKNEETLPFPLPFSFISFPPSLFIYFFFLSFIFQLFALFSFL